MDPLWGGKLTGQLGKVTFATLSASDQAPGRPFDDEMNPHLGRKQGFHIARALYGLGKNRYVGAILTDTEFASGHNRVAGGDVSLRFGNHQTSATFLATQSRSPGDRESRSGLGGQATYLYESKRWLFINQAEHYDPDFQMDTAFYNQTDITANWSFVALSLYPDAKKHPSLKRVVPFFFARFVEDRGQGGHLRFLLPGVRLHTSRQGFFRVDGAFGEEPFAGRQFPIRFVRAMGNAQYTKWLWVNVYAQIGRGILYDEVAPFGGRSRNYNLDVTFQPTSSFNQTVGYNRAEFDRLTGEHEYRVNVLNTRTTYQFSKQFFLRGIVQWDSSRKRILTDLLGSFELLPGTVAYLGYGSLIEERQWDGARLFEGPGGYLTTRRGLFFKASYIHRF